MSLEEMIPFTGVPVEMHRRSIPEALVRVAGLSVERSTAELGLADIAITAYRSDVGWHVFVFDPQNPPSTPEDTFGSFRVNDVALTAVEILAMAETWIRESERTEWVPGSVVNAPDESNDANALGYLLVRAPTA